MNGAALLLVLSVAACGGPVFTVAESLSADPASDAAPALVEASPARSGGVPSPGRVVALEQLS